MPCLAPSEFLTPQAAAAFGAVAEAIIAPDYLKDVGRKSFFPFSSKDFVDFSIGFGNVPLMIAFLKTNNPKLSVSEMAVLSAAGLTKIADLMTHDPPQRTEFYEIKPNSVDGRLAGRTKIALIDALMHGTSLPYVPGVQYTPDKRILIYSGTPLGAKLDVFFHFKRIQAGLIVYEICPEGELEKLGLAVLLAILAIIVIILTRGRVPGGGPVPVPALT